MACPICKKASPGEAPYRPFCSARCKEVDLGHWLSESYRISRPVQPDEMAGEPDAESEDSPRWLN